MTRTSSTIPEPATRVDEPRFEAAAIYALVARLRVGSYDDLLASHWTVADRPRPGERLDLSRFVRSAPAGGTHVVVQLHPSARGGVWHEELSAEATRTVAVVPVALPDHGAEPPGVGGHVQAAPDGDDSRGLAGLGTLVRAWVQSLHLWGVRVLRSWREMLARRLRG